MTECERIISSGRMPADFLKEEMRCGFYVDTFRKKIWAIELDIYMKFAEVCKKHNLKFWGDGGTLLGAVRHNGFIPWDDDIDVIMPREDYNKFMKLPQEEFGEPYFLQTPYTDSNYAFSFIRLRNSNTTCTPKVFAKAGCNNGIYIDIFPLDNLIPSTLESDRVKIYECIMKNSSYMKRNSVDELDERQLKNYYKYHTDDPIAEFEKIQNIISNPLYKGSGYVGNCSVTLLNPERQIWREEWFKETVMHKFEFFEIPMPKMINERLTAQYGSYEEFPPVENRGNWHPDFIWNPDVPYSQLFK